MFCPEGVLSGGLFVRRTFCPEGVLSGGYGVLSGLYAARTLPRFLNRFASNGGSDNVRQCPEGVLSGGCFVRRVFCPEGVLSGGRFVRGCFVLPDFVWPHAAREARGAAAKLPPHRGGNDH